MNEQLLIEEAYVPEVIVESKNGQKNYFIEGVFSTIEERNRNGRIYPRKIWESNVQKYQQEIQNNSTNTLGEFEHPSRVHVDPMKAVMKIVELKIDETGKYVKGKAKILNNNSQETNQIKALIDEGISIGVSSRGTGKLGKGNIVEDFNLNTYDIVTQPSDYNANLKGLRESVEKPVVLENGKLVCKDGICNMQENINENATCDDKAQKLLEAFEKIANKKEIEAESKKWQEIEEKFNFIFEKIKCDTCKKFEKENSDAKITYKKNKSGDTIVYVNGQTAYNLDDNYTEEQALNALERAYKSSLKEGIDSVDILARELAKEKKNLSDAMYKKLHKIMMKNDPKEADKALAELQKIKKLKQ
jgi:hypothetical protein